MRRLTALALTVLADIAQALIAAEATISEQAALIEELEAENERLQADWASSLDRGQRWRTQTREQAAEIERLRAQVANWQTWADNIGGETPDGMW